MKSKEVQLSIPREEFREYVKEDLLPLVERVSSFSAKLQSIGDNYATISSSMNNVRIEEEGMGEFSVNIKGTAEFINGLSREMARDVSSLDSLGGEEMERVDKKFEDPDELPGEVSVEGLKEKKEEVGRMNTDVDISVMEDGEAIVRSEGQEERYMTDFGFMYGNGEIKFGYVDENFSMSRREIETAMEQIKDKLMEMR